jgi:hypothetical protein
VALLPKEAAEGKGKQSAPRRLPATDGPLPALLEKRPDLRGLPVRKETECKLSAEAVATLDEVSSLVRSFGARAGSAVRRRGSVVNVTNEEASAERNAYLMSLLSQPPPKRSRGLTAERVGALEQMLQVEDEYVRMKLVQLFSTIRDEPATLAIVRRALYDPSRNVRSAAVEALYDRPRETTRTALLAGLRYPWAPVADHAAEALVALGDRGAVLDLVELLDRPDPTAITRDAEGRWRVAELVRVNHLGNCLLCHAVSGDKSDPVRGLVPTPGAPLPELYYDSQEGTFARADVTYLRQDFSAMQPVADADPWPAVQRFD